MIGAENYRRLISSIRLDLLALLGKSYIAEHIRGEIRNHQEIQYYRNYIADSIGQLAGMSDLYSAKSNYLFPLFEHDTDTRTEEEITNDNAAALADLCGGGETP